MGANQSPQLASAEPENPSDPETARQTANANARNRIGRAKFKSEKIDAKVFISHLMYLSRVACQTLSRRLGECGGPRSPSKSTKWGDVAERFRRLAREIQREQYVLSHAAGVARNVRHR